MAYRLNDRIKSAENAAREVLRNNFHANGEGLPRTAAWGYPEPYTRDLLISTPGVLASGDRKLIAKIRRVLETLGKNQSLHGLIPGLVDVPADLGSSDTTPLFLIGLEIYRNFVAEKDFLGRAEKKACDWLVYQSPIGNGIVAQLPTSDWRDEQWVFGYGLYVNCLVYLSLKLRRQIRSDGVKAFINHRLSIKGEPYYALYTYKMHKSKRFDLLGNSLAIISGVANGNRGRDIMQWTDDQCELLNRIGGLQGNLPPVLFPYIERGDDDWRKRYEKFNLPGEYHNGGIWPFTIGYYIVALIKLGLVSQAESQLTRLAGLVHKSVDPDLDYGFNEWYKAPTGEPKGQDWQTWSAAAFIYAAECLKRRKVLYFDV